MIKEALNAYALVSGREWATDRSQTVGASEVGQCARKVFWTKNENDPAHAVSRDAGYEDTWGARVRGTVYENAFWEPALRLAYGENLLFAGKDQHTFVSGFLSATPDGLLTTVPEGLLIECKSIDPRVKLDGPKPEHSYQAQVQIGLVRECTEFKPVRAIISYTDTSFWNEVAEYPVDYDEATFENAKDRATMIMTSTNAAELKPEGWIAGGKECEYCPFTTACGVERRRVPEGDGVAVDPQFTAEMADLARQLKFAEGARDLSEKQVRELQIQIKDRLRDKGLKRVVGHGVSVSWSAVKGRQSWDAKAIREAAVAAGIDIEQFSTIGDPTDRLVVTISASKAEKAQADAA